MDATPKTLAIEIPIVEFVDREIHHLEKFENLQAALTAKAVELNHIEILRRLDELNHAHAQNAIDKQNYLPRPMFEQFEADNAKWREAVNKQISESAGANRTLIVVVGFIISMLSIALKFWK
jgi:CHASE3 domain sensor protein